jgi:hypothetical protein
MNTDRLLPILNNTKLQSSNNALYQLLSQLIQIVKDQQIIIDDLTNVTGINANIDTASLVGKTMTFTDGKLTKFV